MLVTKYVEDYLEEVRSFAAKIGKKDQLEEVLNYLGGYACNGDRPSDYTRCTLYKDFAPYSFGFVVEAKNKVGEYQFWFNGGLIFHNADNVEDAEWTVHT